MPGKGGQPWGRATVPWPGLPRWEAMAARLARRSGGVTTTPLCPPTSAPSEAGDEPWLQRRFFQHHPNPQLAAEEQEELTALVEAFLLLFLHRAGLALGLCRSAGRALSSCLRLCNYFPSSALPAVGETGRPGRRPWPCAQPLLPALCSTRRSNSPLMYEQSSITGDG